MCVWVGGWVWVCGSVWVCVCVRVCVCAYMRVMCVHVFACLCLRASTLQVHVHLHACVRPATSACANLCLHPHKHTHALQPAHNYTALSAPVASDSNAPDNTGVWAVRLDPSKCAADFGIRVNAIDAYSGFTVTDTVNDACMCNSQRSGTCGLALSLSLSLALSPWR